MADRDLLYVGLLTFSSSEPAPVMLGISVSVENCRILFQIGSFKEELCTADEIVPFGILIEL